MSTTLGSNIEKGEIAQTIEGTSERDSGELASAFNRFTEKSINLSNRFTENVLIAREVNKRSNE
jgi:hypothetical protein